jgi:zinc-ribbon domain
MKTVRSGNQNRSMPPAECFNCHATVPADARFCPQCGAPAPDPDGIETRLRTYWSSPDLGMLVGVALAGGGVVLVALGLLLWGILALVLAALILVLRSAVGRREAGGLLGAVRTRFTAHSRVVGARSRGQIELFRLRRELAEMQTERSRGYQELGRATHVGDEEAAEAAKARLDEVGERVGSKEAEIAALVSEMEERVRRAQAEIIPTSMLERPPEPVPEPAAEPPPEPARDLAPEPPPAPETKRRRRSRASNT